MVTTNIEETALVGLALKSKTTNKDGRSNIDCGNLWETFNAGNYTDRIPGRMGDEIFAVYHQYAGDHTQPFSYFLGCRVKADTDIPDGMDSLVIPRGSYRKFVATGKMPDCIADTWKEIWQSDVTRAFKTDFEVYDERSRDWNAAEVDIFISVE